MKYILSLGIAFLIVGCSTSSILPETHNAVIPLGDEEVGIFIPESWEKIPLPSNTKNIILLAQNNSENIAISFNESEEMVTGTSLCAGAEKGFSPFEQTFVDDNHCFFSGHPSPDTPIRHFWQKTIHLPEKTSFLLASCSTEKREISSSQCSNILESFKILDKKE